MMNYIVRGFWVWVFGFFSSTNFFSFSLCSECLRRSFSFLYSSSSKFSFCFDLLLFSHFLRSQFHVSSNLIHSFCLKIFFQLLLLPEYRLALLFVQIYDCSLTFRLSFSGHRIRQCLWNALSDDFDFCSLWAHQSLSRICLTFCQMICSMSARRPFSSDCFCIRRRCGCPLMTLSPICHRSQICIFDFSFKKFNKFVIFFKLIL